VGSSLPGRVHLNASSIVCTGVSAGDPPWD
jgi:hypothetical protein